MTELTSLRHIPHANLYRKGDVFVLFGELFGRGYVNGLIDEARAAGMTIVGITVGRRDEEGKLRALTTEEHAEAEEKLGGRIINVPLMAGFDMDAPEGEKNPTELLSGITLKSWQEDKLDWDAIERCRAAGVQRFTTSVAQAMQEIDKLILLAGGNTLDASTMQSLVADAARYDVFRLTDAVLDGQAALVSRMLAGLRAEGDAVAGLMPMVIRELLRTAALARAQARGGNLGAEMKSQGIWEARQAPFKRALQRHPNPARWDRFVAEASRIDRIAKGRADGDAWIAMERLLLAIAAARAVRLLVA